MHRTNQVKAHLRDAMYDNPLQSHMHICTCAQSAGRSRPKSSITSIRNEQRARKHRRKHIGGELMGERHLIQLIYLYLFTNG